MYYFFSGCEYAPMVHSPSFKSLYPPFGELNSINRNCVTSNSMISSRTFLCTINMKWALDEFSWKYCVPLRSFIYSKIKFKEGFPTWIQRMRGGWMKPVGLFIWLQLFVDGCVLSVATFIRTHFVKTLGGLAQTVFKNILSYNAAITWYRKNSLAAKL